MYDPTSEVDVVLVDDPALDWPSDEAKEAYVKRREPELWRAVVREGASPTVYHCKPLSPMSGYESDRIVANSERWGYLFLASCRSITLPDGRTIRADGGGTRKFRPFTKHTKLATEEWLCEAFDAVGMDNVYGIGAMLSDRVHLKAEDRGPL